MSELTTNSDLLGSARLDGDVIVAQVRGEIDLHNSPDLRDALLDLLVRHRPRRMILDLSQVPYMDSSAIAVLVEVLRKIRAAGGKLCLVQLQPRVKNLLVDIARLDTIFVIANTEQEAREK